MSFRKKLKKNLMLLITMVGLSYSSFSQNVTKELSIVPKDSTNIILTRPIAKLVVKDLVTGDLVKQELIVTNELLIKTEEKLNTQTLLVNNLQTQLTNYEGIVLELQNKYNVQADLSKDLEKALRKQRNRTKFYKLGTTVGAVAVGLLLIQ